MAWLLVALVLLLGLPVLGAAWLITGTPPASRPLGLDWRGW